MPKALARALLMMIGAAQGCGAHPPLEPGRTETERRVFDVPARSSSFDERNRDCMALALYWEARGEGPLGMAAVGWTIMNRIDSAHFPSTACAVVFQGGERPGCQFSWYCDGKSDRPRDRRSWSLARRVATRLLTDPPPDPTGGALFYHSTGVHSPWHRTRRQTARIGGHVFYR